MDFFVVDFFSLMKPNLKNWPELMIIYSCCNKLSQTYYYAVLGIRNPKWGLVVWNEGVSWLYSEGWGDSFPYPFLFSKDCPYSLAHDPLPFSKPSKASWVFFTSHHITLAWTRLLPSPSKSKNPFDYIGIIQGSLPILSLGG